MGLREGKQRASDFERCSVLCGVIIIFMKKQNEEGIRKIKHRLKKKGH
jgi:hypothetical protein